MKSKINEDLYSRQIFTYGLELMEKISDLKILIIGLRGLGIEIAKNLILNGLNEICISDKNICKINDLGTNYFINESSVNKETREKACFEKLVSLNPYVKVSIMEGNILDNIKRFNLIIITEIMNSDELIKINKACRDNNKGFIYGLNFGLAGFLFNDFNDHLIYDSNGEKNLSYQIFNIEEKDNYYEIYIDTSRDKNFLLKKGEYVLLKEIQGLEFLNDDEPKKIIKTTNESFFIEKIDNLDKKYINGGIVEEIKVPKKLKFKNLEYYFNDFDKNYVLIDSSKIYNNILLHCSFLALHKYYDIHDSLPKLNDIKQINEAVDLSFKYYNELKEKNLDNFKLRKKNKILEFNENIIKNVIKWCQCEISPICSFLGGIISQEAIKITGKYQPIYQWIRFEFFELIDDIPDNCDRNCINSRYDDQISIFGKEIQDKLGNLNIFMIGAGALGCEYLKNFALMGISCNEKDKNNILTVTDNDAIELSNLNRQFLFNNEDIGKFKSVISCKKAKNINKNLNVKPLKLLLNEESKQIFNDNFWEKQDIIISAVDNNSVRKFIDTFCTFYNKILIDAGTEGVKANSDIYIPNKTICLNDLDFESKKIIPMCTLKNFPTEIEHCIEWSKNIFNEIFFGYIKDIKLIIEDLSKFYYLLEEEKNTDELYLKIEIFKCLLDILKNPNNFMIIKLEVFVFNYYFDFKIKKLLKEYENQSYVFEYNRKPSSINIDFNDEDNNLYFKSFYSILSDIINSNKDYELKEIISIVNQISLNIEVESFDKNKLIEGLKSIITKDVKQNSLLIEKIKSLKPMIFEKDSDENNHINFMLAISNLRAKNYNIKKTNFLRVKEIAGNIIPAIASTTAAITGLNCLQIYEILIKSDIDINKLRSSAINLGTSEFDLSIPEEVRYIKDIPKTKSSPEYKVIPQPFTVWDKIDIGPNLTVKQLIDDFKKRYDIDIDYINYNNIKLAEPIESNENDDQTIEFLLMQKSKDFPISHLKYITLNINCSRGMIEILMPTIRYLLK